MFHSNYRGDGKALVILSHFIVTGNTAFKTSTIYYYLYWNSQPGQV